MADFKYKIYVDMDGVLTNYEKQFEHYSGGISVKDYESKYGNKARYFLVKKNCPDFYASMEWMVDGRELYEFVKNLNSEILSHATDLPAKVGKLQWLKDNNINIKANLVPHRVDKIKFANNNSILIDDRPDTINEFKAAGGIGILHKNTNQTLKELQSYLTMNESKHRIYNSVLNPDLWQNGDKLKPEIQNALLKIAKTFFESTDLEVPLEDVLLLGSAAGYNWTPTSDVDLHLVIDFSKVDEDPDLVQKYVDGLKSSWNEKHNIKLGNHPVEVYIQDKDHKTHSQSIYSIVDNKWIKKAKYEPPNVDKDMIKFKYHQFVKYINDAIDSGDVEKMNQLVTKLYDIRQSGLDTGGEFSVENLVFKLLRSTEYLKKLKDAIVVNTDKDLSKI